MLALRSDMTIPIARVVATRYADADPPLRFCYFAHAWRAVERGVGEPREFLQGGLELIGVPGPEGEAEVVALTVAALDAAGLRRHRIGVGDGSLYRSLLGSLGVPEERHLPLLEALSRRDLVGLEAQVTAIAGLGAERARAARAAARAARRPRGAGRGAAPSWRACGRCTTAWSSAAWPTA